MNNETRTHFLKILRNDKINSAKLYLGWKKMLEAGIENDFLVNGAKGNFFDFICDMDYRTQFLENPEDAQAMLYKTIPNPTLRFTGDYNTVETTATLNEKGYPMGYIEEIDADGIKINSNTRYFAILDNHSLFYGDTHAHNGKSVFTYIDLQYGEPTITRFTDQHEAYRRIISPTIDKIEKALASHCIDHAPELPDM